MLMDLTHYLTTKVCFLSVDTTLVGRLVLQMNHDMHVTALREQVARLQSTIADQATDIDQKESLRKLVAEYQAQTDDVSRGAGVIP